MQLVFQAREVVTEDRFAHRLFLLSTTSWTEVALDALFP